MTVAIPNTDSAAAVTGRQLLIVLPAPGTSGDPVSQAIADVIGEALDGLAEFTYDASNNTFAFTVQANSVTAAMARATTLAHRREWRNRLGIADDWSEIPANTPIELGKVVEHGGAYFGCITAHNRGGTGPDGDAVNWTLLSNWRGDWVDAWYPVGALVRRAGLPYVATQAVQRGNPAPDATTNVKWLRLGAASIAVVSGAVNQNIPASANGHTYVLTGSNARTFFLPAASGGGAVADGWEVVLVNRSTAVLTADPDGTDQVAGSGSLDIAAGRVVRLQKVAAGQFAIIADTKDEAGTGMGSSFTPSKENLYDAVKAIFEHNPSVTADDTDNELDFSPGAAGALADDSILPVKARSSTAAFKKDWRDQILAAHVALASTTLPAVAGFSVGRDFVILGRSSSNTGVGFRDISDPSTVLTESVSGDVFWLQNSGWTRVGNIREGSPVLRARIATIETKVDRLTVFGQADLSPRGITNNVFPEFMALHLAEKIDSRDLAQIQVAVGGVVVGTINTADALRTFNAPAGAAGNRAGGIINLSLTSQARANLAASVGMATQFTEVQIRYKFSGTSLAANVEPDVVDSVRMGTNNNSYRGTERRFETAVGASPAVLPLGTHTIEVEGTHDGVVHSRRFRVSAFTAATVKRAIESGNVNSASGDRDSYFNVSYVAATRTMTYTFSGVALTARSVYAIGEA